MRYTGPRNRLARRNGVDLELKTFGSKNHNKLMSKLTVPPGEHGLNTRRKTSEHSKQLREKQKLRFMYGVSERQMGNYFNRAKKSKGNTGNLLCSLMESRLDNAVYRAGFAPTRAAARQLVTHGNVKVNDHKLSIPSYEIKVGQKISLGSEKVAKIPTVEASLARKDIVPPSWIKRDGVSAEVLQSPTTDSIEKLINVRLIIEFYSK